MGHHPQLRADAELLTQATAMLVTLAPAMAPVSFVTVQTWFAGCVVTNTSLAVPLSQFHRIVGVTPGRFGRDF
jgi:hypothetical protein